MHPVSYSEAVAESRAYLSLTLDLSEPVEIEDFARLFSGFGSQFDDYLRDEHPQLKGHARLFVREVREGSIVADLVPSIPDLVGYMDNVLIVLGFASLFSKRVRSFISGIGVPGFKKSDLSHVADTITAVSNDPNGVARLESIVYEEDGPKKRLEAQFTSSEARKAMETVERQKRELDAVERADHERVLMTFEQSNIRSINVGKRSGELVKVDRISDKALALMYGSAMAEDRIKHEIRDADENVYKKGFVVDVNVESRNGKPVAYSVTNFHHTVDLPDD